MIKARILMDDNKWYVMRLTIGEYFYVKYWIFMHHASWRGMEVCAARIIWPWEERYIMG